MAKSKISVFGDLDVLMTKVDSKFSLVNVATKRAKQLNNHPDLALTEHVNLNKPVSTALNEIADGRIQFHRTREGIK
ncbi:MAG TPA: DNA-directed RNA polymerase subunit omega [Candidatus Baltobacteraceae bacterium]|jgi:DNA-directed RNA polymerase subunit omega